jgi:hypothetical protein
MDDILAGYSENRLRLPTPAYIAEMRSAQYSPDLIANAQATLAQWGDLPEQIARAFEGVVLGNGIGLNEATALDNYADHAERLAARQTDERLDYRAISEHELIYAGSAVSFVDAAGMRFLLPAWMLLCLSARNTGNLDISWLGDKDSRFVLFTDAQRESYMRFVAYCESRDWQHSEDSEAPL